MRIVWWRDWITLFLLTAALVFIIVQDNHSSNKALIRL